MYFPIRFDCHAYTYIGGALPHSVGRLPLRDFCLCTARFVSTFPKIAEKLNQSQQEPGESGGGSVGKNGVINQNVHQVSGQ